MVFPGALQGPAVLPVTLGSLTKCLCPCHRPTMKAWGGGKGGYRRDNPVTHIPSKLLQHCAAGSDESLGGTVYLDSLRFVLLREAH